MTPAAAHAAHRVGTACAQDGACAAGSAVDVAAVRTPPLVEIPTGAFDALHAAYGAAHSTTVGVRGRACPCVRVCVLACARVVCVRARVFGWVGACV